MRKYLWNIMVRIYPTWLRWIYKMDLAPTVIISWKAKLDKSINPRGVHIGDYTWVLSGATILAHDHCRRLKTDMYIGERCIIGINSIIMPGVRIGDSCVVGGGCIVTKDLPDHCMVVGNPARIIKEGVEVNEYGQLVN